MFRAVKAMTVAGMIAMGVPLLTEAANAQAVLGQWNILRAAYCWTQQQFNPDGSLGTNYLTVVGNNPYTSPGSPGYNYFSFFVSDSAVIPILFKWCASGNFFYVIAESQGASVPWNSVFVYDGFDD
jgi:hypothetical protein